MSKRKIALIISLSLVGAISLAVALPFIVLGVRSSTIGGDYSSLKSDSTYSKKVEVEGVELVTQKVSCGYATIEMMSSFYGERVSEESLKEKNNGGISTSSSEGFLKEINASISSKKFISASYLPNEALLKTIHISLSKENPVAIEWAAKYENEWTLHFSLVTKLDIANDLVEVYNPYGYVEELGLNDFLKRTSFEAYEGMPFFLSFGFAFGVFEKNAVFYAAN